MGTSWRKVSDHQVTALKVGCERAIRPHRRADRQGGWQSLGYLILAPSSPGTGRGGTGCWFLVDNADRAYDALKGRGYTFNEAPFDIPPGRLVTLFDADGNLPGLIDNSKGGMPGQG